MRQSRWLTKSKNMIQPSLQGRKNLGLNKPAIKILENEEVNGLDFFDLTQEELEHYGMKLGPVKRLIKFTKDWLFQHTIA
ncbi:hypothetical protein RclHR1_02680028 [Rhizophagus clarus]|uniref:SAM domain-containing protein n=1 Tax=Rhizophagus clarus TaxID=94130 RepID=A0A2Z6RDQ7_9GLOM|nr:hypothetical protein RclHR1_02680028 [Rhizophagus clarus]